MQKRLIKFSPPDITDEKIAKVVDTLKSGWLTTGPKTKLFKNHIRKYCRSAKTVCLNSATTGLEMTLKLFDIYEDDKVIPPAYTYMATTSAILHCGATPVMCDIKENSFNIDPHKRKNAIKNRKKAIMLVDFSEKFQVIAEKQELFTSQKDTYQEKLGRILVLSNRNHSFETQYNDKISGNIADFTDFSFHAIKNLTSAEKGAVTWKENSKLNNQEVYKDLQNKIPPTFQTYNTISSKHLFQLRIKNITEPKLDEIISKLKDLEIPKNVRFIPLPIHSPYKNLGYNIQDYIIAYKLYNSDITLPVNTQLSINDMQYICYHVKQVLKDF